MRARESEQTDPSGELGGRRAVVTGSSSGIGRAIALELAAAGADVLVTGCRSRREAIRTAREIEAMGRAAPVVMADLATPGGCRALVAAAWRAFGRVDIWVNNAGADILTGSGARLSYERKLERLWRIDVLAAMRLSRAAGERMAKRGEGTIINMGWDGARGGLAGESGELFAAAKGAVMSFSTSLALSLAPRVRVNCLAPGWIRTAWGRNAPAAWRRRVLRGTPLKRWGSPEDVAKLARFLASPEAGFITGQIVAVNGGAVRF